MDIEDFLEQDIDIERLRRETYGDVREAVEALGIPDGSPAHDGAVEALTAAALAVGGRMLAQYHEWLMHQLP